jgi:hypothetical protein
MKDVTGGAASWRTRNKRNYIGLISQPLLDLSAILDRILLLRLSG